MPSIRATFVQQSLDLRKDPASSHHRLSRRSALCCTVRSYARHASNMLPYNAIRMKHRSSAREPLLKKPPAASSQDMTSDYEPLDLQGDKTPSVAFLQPLVSWLDAFIRFSRPHTIIGTTLSVISVSLLALDGLADINTRFVIGLLQALIPAMCMNVYIVGLNQLFDIEIDKVNKPYLPLASGEFSVKMGLILISAFAAVSLALGLASGSVSLMWTLVISMILGTAYSIDLPFLRWKRVPFLAAGCIFTIRAVVVQIGFFQHMKFSLSRASFVTRPILFATLFMSLFSVVIALFKDIPDVKGDLEFGIQSFSVQLGQRKIFWVCISTLMAAYLGGVYFGFLSTVWWSKVVTMGGHLLAGLLLWRRAQSTDLSSHDAIFDAYMFVWKLFYAEYLLLPFLR